MPMAISAPWPALDQGLAAEKLALVSRSKLPRALGMEGSRPSLISGSMAPQNPRKVITEGNSETKLPSSSGLYLQFQLSCPENLRDTSDGPHEPWEQAVCWRWLLAQIPLCVHTIGQILRLACGGGGRKVRGSPMFCPSPPS